MVIVMDINILASSVVFFFNDTATTEIYTLSLHDALPICADAHEEGPGRAAERGGPGGSRRAGGPVRGPRPGAGRRSEEHTSELQSRQYLVCRLLLEKKEVDRLHPLVVVEVAVCDEDWPSA